jgi:MFS family permease
MVEGLMFLASYGYFQGGALGNLLNVWEQAGIFSYAIPFLLIFALVFGILSRMNIFKKSNNEPNTMISAIIALAIALMALQFPFVPMFFAELFPALGIGLAIILVVLVISGLFIDPDNKGWMVGLMIVSVIVVIGVLLSASRAAGFIFGTWWRYNWVTIASIGVFLALIIAIVAASNPRKDFKANNILAQALRAP